MTTDDFTEAARAEAKRYWLDTLQDETAGIGELGQHMAEWARERLTTQEPTGPEVEAAVLEWEHHQPYKRFRMWWCRCGAPGKWGSLEAHLQHALWHVLSAVRRARHEGSPARTGSLEHRVRILHAPDADGNCGHCTRGRVYPVPAPCETVRALAGGGEGR